MITSKEVRTEICPHCGANLDGGSILETFKDQRAQGLNWCKDMSDEQLEQYMKDSYSPPYRWSRIISVEHQGDDRVAYQICPDCEKPLP